MPSAIAVPFLDMPDRRVSVSVQFCARVPVFYLYSIHVDKPFDLSFVTATMFVRSTLRTNFAMIY